MTPPAKWYLAVESERIYVFKDGKKMRHEGGPNSGKEYGGVRALTLQRGKNGEMLKFKFVEGNPRGFFLANFDWAKSEFSKFFHIKNADTEVKFVESWNTFVAESLNSETGVYSISKATDSSNTKAVATPNSSRVDPSKTPESALHQDQETTTNSTVQPTPFRPHKAGGSKKRTLEAVDQAEIPNMRPAKVVRLNQKGGSTQQPEKEDHAIQQAFVGYYTLPVSCLIQPSPARLLRPVDELFVESLKSAMKSNPSTDVAPIVGIVLLPEGEQFQETQKESYQYETIGGNNSRAALADLVENEDNPIFRTRLVSVYHGLTDTEALRLAARHNSATSLHHAMTTWEKVQMCRTLMYSLSNTEAGDDVPEKPKTWRSQCSAVLYQPVRVLDDACIFFLAALPKEAFSVLEKVFDMYSKGEVKGQVAKRGSLGKKLDLKGSNFKHMRGLDVEVVMELLTEVAEDEIGITEMGAECLKIKRLRDIQGAFVKETGVESWEEAQSKFPDFTTSEAFDEFLHPSISNKSLTPRFKDYCQMVMRRSMQPPASLSDQPGCFTLNGTCALLVQGTCIAFDQLSQVCTSSHQNFTGVALTLINTADLETVEEKMIYHLKMLVRSVRGLNTTAGLHSYSVAVICRPEQISIVGESLGACSLQSHAAFVHREGCTEPATGTALYNSVNAIVIGENGRFPSEGRRTNLFTSTKEVCLQDDDGKALRNDLDNKFYEEFLAVFSKPSQWVLFQNTITGEGPVSALRMGRNTIAMTTTKEDFLLVKRDISMKLE